VKTNKSIKDVGVESARLRFNSHQDALDFADHCVKNSRDWMTAHNLDFAERDLNLKMEIAFRLKIRGTDSEYEFVLNAVPDKRCRYHRTGRGLSATEDKGIETTAYWAHDGVLLQIGNVIENPKEWARVASAVRIEPAHNRCDVRRDIFAPPIYGVFDVGIGFAEREGCFARLRQSGTNGGSVARLIEDRPEIMDSITSKVCESFNEGLCKSYLVLFNSASMIYLNRTGPWVIVNESTPLPFELGDVFLCAI